MCRIKNWFHYGRSTLFCFVFLGLFAFVLSAFPAWADLIEKPYVQIRILNKITGQARKFKLVVGETVAHGQLRIKPQVCRKSEPIDMPEAAAFIEIWEMDKNKENPDWVFSGWMFASSPGISAMDHPVYDVWILDCLDKTVTPKPEEATEEPGRVILEPPL